MSVYFLLLFKYCLCGSFHHRHYYYYYSHFHLQAVSIPSEYYVDTIPLQGTYESGCISEYNGHFIYRSIIRCDKNNIVKEVIVYTVEHLDEECKNQFLETSFVYSTELSSEVSGMNNASRL